MMNIATPKQQAELEAIGRSLMAWCREHVRPQLPSGVSEDVRLANEIITAMDAVILGAGGPDGGLVFNAVGFALGRVLGQQGEQIASDMALAMEAGIQAGVHDALQQLATRGTA